MQHSHATAEFPHALADTRLEKTTAWQQAPGLGLHCNTMATLICKARIDRGSMG